MNEREFLNEWQASFIGTPMEPISAWQVFVCIDSEQGGLCVPCQPYEPTGFWLDINASEAAQAVIHQEWVRLS